MKLFTNPLLLLFFYFFAGPTAHSKLTILSPTSLASKFDKAGGLDYRVPDFGNFPFGSQIVGKLVIANPIDACSPIRSFYQGEGTHGDNLIAVVLRGGCREPHKVHNVEHAGAKVMLLVNDNDLLPEFVHGIQSGRESNIPTVLITRTDGDKIIDSLRKNGNNNGNNQEAVVSISFPTEMKRRTVNVDFWFSASDSYRIASEFLSHLRTIIRDYEEVFIFNPHYVTWTCGKCRMDKFTYADRDCISGGRYCAPDPDDDGPQTGKDIIMEDLRQMCIWKTNHELWWQYVLSFENKCLVKADLKDCSTKLLGQIATPAQVSEIAQCIQTSFTPSENRGGVINQDIDDNSLMKREKKLQEDFDVTHFPILYINYKKFHGRISHIHQVYMELCEQISVPMDVCMDLLESSDENSRRYQMKKMMKKGMIFFGIATFFGVVVFLFYRRAAKRESRSMAVEANDMVYNYFALQDSEPLDRSRGGNN